MASGENDQAAKMGVNIGPDKGKCIVCGEPCKTSITEQEDYMCAGCHQPFHIDPCGVPHACNKCIGTLSPGDREPFVEQMRTWRWYVSRMVLVFFCSGFSFIMSGGLIAFSFWTSQDDIIWADSLTLTLLGAALCVIAMAIWRRLDGKMWKRARTVLLAHPVPGVAQLKEPETGLTGIK